MGADQTLTECPVCGEPLLGEGKKRSTHLAGHDASEFGL